MISGVNESIIPFSIKISHNTITKCIGDSISIKNIKGFDYISLKKNIITKVKGNGISLISINQDVNFVKLKGNKVNDNKGTGIFLYNAVCDIEDCSCSHNASKGIYVIMVRSLYSSKFQTVISNCTFHNNLGSGIKLATSNARVVINESQIFKNREYGIELDKTEFDNSNSSFFRSSRGDSSCLMGKEKKDEILIKYGNINENIRGGIYLDLKCTINISEAFIKNNDGAAIFK